MYKPEAGLLMSFFTQNVDLIEMNHSKIFSYLSMFACCFTILSGFTSLSFKAYFYKEKYEILRVYYLNYFYIRLDTSDSCGCIILG